MEELEGVLAHELTHIRNHDTLTQAVAGTIAGAITFLGRVLTFSALYGPVTRDNCQSGNPLGVLFLIVLAPIAAALLQFAISRPCLILQKSSNSPMFLIPVKMPGFVIANSIFIKIRVKSRTIDFTY